MDDDSLEACLYIARYHLVGQSIPCLVLGLKSFPVKDDSLTFNLQDHEEFAEAEKYAQVAMDYGGKVLVALIPCISKHTSSLCTYLSLCHFNFTSNFMTLCSLKKKPRSYFACWVTQDQQAPKWLAAQESLLPQVQQQ